MTSTLVHYGITGQKWGKRRWQNKDGTLTPAGKERYRTGGSLIEEQKIEEQKIEEQKIEEQKIEEQKIEEKKISSMISKGKEVVNKILRTAKTMATKIKNVASSAINNAKNFVAKLFNIKNKSTVKKLTQRELDDEIVKKAYGVKSSSSKSSSNQKTTVKRLTQRELDDEMVKRAYGVKK